MTVIRRVVTNAIETRTMKELAKRNVLMFERNIKKYIYDPIEA